TMSMTEVTRTQARIEPFWLRSRESFTRSASPVEVRVLDVQLRVHLVILGRVLPGFARDGPVGGLRGVADDEMDLDVRPVSGGGLVDLEEAGIVGRIGRRDAGGVSV